MLAIRLQRTGRKGHAQFRMVVQDSRRTPTSGRYVYLLGNYDPHSKTINVDKEKAEFYLQNGARPSERVALLLKKEGVKLPDWVIVEANKQGALRNADKLRKNRPAEEKAEEPAAEAPAEEVADAPADAPEEVAEAPAEAETEAPTEEKA
ncbi:MAG: small subunit ribosomal protein [Patescibacteria group bacterium]|nr:small subunit ribosomal protein [Patescibacteria group bacterium]